MTPFRLLRRAEATTALEPDEDTMEQATAPVAVAEAPTSRKPSRCDATVRGPVDAGSRSCAIILALAVAAMVIWWSLAR